MSKDESEKIDLTVSSEDNSNVIDLSSPEPAAKADPAKKAKR